jgi:hypothetical protein
MASKGIEVGAQDIFNGFKKHGCENLRRNGDIGYRHGWNMSAKPTLVVHSRRTDEADGNGNTGARAHGLWRTSTANAREGANDAACKGAGDHATSEGARGGTNTRTRIEDSEGKE